MKLNQALKVLEKNYKITQRTLDVYVIEIDQDFDDLNKMTLAIKEIDGEAYITDYGYTCQFTDMDIEQIKEICKNNNVHFFNYAIQCKYNNENDIKNLISCINEIINS